MALLCANILPVEEFDGSVRFFMIARGSVIECRVTRDALDERALREQLAIFKSGELFLEYRDQIERKADRRLASGDLTPTVESF